jgi:predicted O-methyltransferase YrrM
MVRAHSQPSRATRKHAGSLRPSFLLAAGYFYAFQISAEEFKRLAEKARRNLDEAGLSAFSEVREGDAMQTLGDLAAPIDFLFLDGWKDLYLPVLDLLKPKLRKGSVVVADNILFPPMFKKTMKRYVTYMHDPANGFQSTTLPLGAGIEYSVFKG